MEEEKIERLVACHPGSIKKARLMELEGKVKHINKKISEYSLEAKNDPSRTSFWNKCIMTYKTKLKGVHNEINRLKKIRWK